MESFLSRENGGKVVSLFCLFVAPKWRCRMRRTEEKDFLCICGDERTKQQGRRFSVSHFFPLLALFFPIALLHARSPFLSLSLSNIRKHMRFLPFRFTLSVARGSNKFVLENPQKLVCIGGFYHTSLSLHERVTVSV